MFSGLHVFRTSQVLGSMDFPRKAQCMNLLESRCPRIQIPMFSGLHVSRSTQVSSIMRVFLINFIKPRICRENLDPQVSGFFHVYRGFSRPQVFGVFNPSPLARVGQFGNSFRNTRETCTHWTHHNFLPIEHLPTGDGRF